MALTDNPMSITITDAVKISAVLKGALPTSDDYPGSNIAAYILWESTEIAELYLEKVSSQVWFPGGLTISSMGFNLTLSKLKTLGPYRYYAVSRTTYGSSVPPRGIMSSQNDPVLYASYDGNTYTHTDGYEYIHPDHLTSAVRHKDVTVDGVTLTIDLIAPNTWYIHSV